MSAEISEMTMADYDAVLALWQSVEGLGIHTEECDSRDAVARYLLRNPGLCFVSRDAGRLVGAVLCGHDGRRGYLNHLAVSASHRRRGIASALVRRCLGVLAGLGIRRCNLFVFATNKGGIDFWHRLGWQCFDEFGVKVLMSAVVRDK